MNRLHTLELRGNQLASTDGLHLPNLKNLFLAGNRIRQVTGLGRMESLTTLHLRDNQIETLDGFTDQMKNLQYLNMRGNGISSLRELNKLKCLPMLRAVVLSENPIAEDDEYRLEVLTVLRKVIRLDKDEYQDDEREEAEARYEQRRLEELNKEEMEEGKEEEDDATAEAAADEPVEE
ncbi:hypothetical protein BOX15_Mlig021015g2 [Macrostomum lignano]|nr:hypothetical protein BOX15_Mlig021015g2 [Macrostomum lignano]